MSKANLTHLTATSLAETTPVLLSPVVLLTPTVDPADSDSSASLEIVDKFSSEPNFQSAYYTCDPQPWP